MRDVCRKMRAVTAGIFSCVAILFAAQDMQAQTPKFTTCDCEANTCGPCETETGVTFYSAKCGPNDSRVKSCKKPTCVAVENQNACLVKLGLPLPPGAAPAVAEKAAGRGAASESNEGEIAGEVKQFEGLAQIVRQSGPPESPRENQVVYVGDRIETKANGKVKILLRDNSEMIVAANSRVKVELVKIDPAVKSRAILLNLMHGKVRSRVQKVEGESSFKVKTPTAVAGVRGTDFVASFQPDRKEWVSEIRTFEGMVHLDKVERAGTRDVKPSGGVDVPAGTYASLVIGPPSRTDDDEEFLRAIEAGQFSPTMKMKDEEVEDLNKSTDFVVAKASSKVGEGAHRQPAAASSPDEICREPAGRFKQCSFTCEGNPAGEKTCRTDRSGVTCVRRFCNGNGSWSEPRRMPASEAVQCQPGKTIVKDCENYW